MRVPPVDHVELCPSVLYLRSAGSSYEEVELELTLEVVLLDVIGLSADERGRESGGHRQLSTESAILIRLRKRTRAAGLEPAR